MKERKYVLGALVACLVIVASTLAGLAAAKPGKKEAAFKVAWIYPGPHNDGGWSQAHDAGRLAVQKALGSKVQTTYKENVPEGPQVAQVIDSLISDGNKIIFATSFGYQPAMVAAAKKYPDIKFEMATGYLTSKNMAVYYGMISFMDEQIGRILDALDRLGLAGNTLVVFSTDHGHFLGQHGLIAKGAFHYEDLLRVPFLVAAPAAIPER